MHGSLSVCRCAGIALTLLSGAGACAHAGLIQWGYNWEPSATKIAADGGGTGYLGITDESSKTAAGSSNTVVTNLRAFSTGSTANPDVFNHANFSFTLQLKDLASSATGTVTISGFFSGKLTANNANIKANFTSPTTETLSLGGNTYTVTLGTYTPPGPPGDANAGSLNALVTVKPGNGGGGGIGTPEPSTLTLAALALPCTGLAGWRRRKRGSMPPSLFAVRTTR